MADDDKGTSAGADEAGGRGTPSHKPLKIQVETNQIDISDMDGEVQQLRADSLEDRVAPSLIMPGAEEAIEGAEEFDPTLSDPEPGDEFTSDPEPGDEFTSDPEPGDEFTEPPPDPNEPPPDPNEPPPDPNLP